MKINTVIILLAAVFAEAKIRGEGKKVRSNERMWLAGWSGYWVHILFV
jgi:hypothetical protein